MALNSEVQKMKSAKLFLWGMYFHLILSMLVPFGMLYLLNRERETLASWLFLLYLAMIAMLHILGWICVAMAVVTYRQKQTAKLRHGWKLLKLWPIPFYVLNFLYSCFIWFILVGASRGILIFWVPIPIFITYVLIFQSGCVGICNIMYLRKQPENFGKPGGIHYVLQLVPILDVVSTVMIMRKYKTY